MKPLARLLIALAMPLLVLLLPAFATAEAFITVCVSGPPACDYASIQAAIDAAGFGDTIIVGAGTYTEQLTLKSGLSITSTAGPTSTIVTASASPIISGSQITSVTLHGLGIQGNSALTTPVGLDFFSSTLTLSNIILSDLHGISGTTTYTNGADAIGLRLTGNSDLTLANVIIQNISGGNGLLGSGATGGDAFGLWAEGSGTVSMTTTTLRQIVGGDAGTYASWPFSCDGRGGPSVAVHTNGNIDLSIADSTITDLVAGEPCRPSAQNCSSNAGTVSGIETVGGSLALYDTELSKFTGWGAYNDNRLPQTGWESPVNYALHTTAMQHVTLQRNRIIALTVNFLNIPSQRPGTPDSPYCAPPPGSFAGIASNGDRNVQIIRNYLYGITGLNSNAYGKGVSVHAAQAVTITGNYFMQLSGGPRNIWWGLAPDYQALGIEVSTAETVSIKDNRIEQLRGSDGESVYMFTSTDGGGAAGIQIESVAHSQIVNNIITSLIGGRGADIVDHWAPASPGGDAIGINLNGGLSQVWNNTVYDLRGGAGGQPDQPAGASAGLKASAMSNVLVFNNAFISSTVGVTLTSSAYLWDYNALWDTALSYSGIVTGTHDLHIDPRFIDATHGDFHLAFSSPLIDRGLTPIFPSDDLDGNPRPNDGNGDGVPVTDIGAYEFQPVPLNRHYLSIILH